MKLTYNIWDKTKQRYVNSIDFADGETLFLAVTPDGELIQYGNYTNHAVGEVANPENFEILLPFEPPATIKELEVKRIQNDTKNFIDKAFKYLME